MEGIMVNSIRQSGSMICIDRVGLLVDYIIMT